VAGVTLAALALWATACGSSTQTQAAGGSATASGSAASVGTLNVLAQEVTSYAGVTGWVAQAEGLYKKEGLTVNFIEQTSTQNQLLASGKADLDPQPFPSNLVAAGSGLDVRIIYELESAGSTALVVNSKYTTQASLQANHSCRLATVQTGTAAYADAKIFLAKLKLNCTLVIASSPAIIAAGVASGSYDAGVLNWANVYKFGATDPATSHIRLLLQPDQVNSLLGASAGGYQEIGVEGIASNLQKKRAAVVAYITALNEAQTMVQSMTAEQIATLLLKLPQWKGINYTTTVESLKLKVGWPTAAAPFGLITEASWHKSLDAFTSWGVAGYEPTNPLYSYGKRVDMSYAEAASK
jgi:hypothetical protein